MHILLVLSTLDEFQIDEETGTSQYPEMTFIIDLVDNVCAVYFALEYFLRLLCCPKKIKFFFSGMNFIDFLAIIPLFLTILLESIKDLAIMGKAGWSCLTIQFIIHHSVLRKFVFCFVQLTAS